MNVDMLYTIGKLRLSTLRWYMYHVHTPHDSCEIKIYIKNALAPENVRVHCHLLRRMHEYILISALTSLDFLHYIEKSQTIKIINLYYATQIHTDTETLSRVLF